MEHPAFADAGKEVGLEIWTIDKFEPVPIDTKMYGKFYNGDSYIVLSTKQSSSALTFDAHFWLGSETSQDKKGAAAILTITLDDQLGGRAVHHREMQGHESATFLGYFKPAIRYLEGGTESGFKEVETNAGAERRLLRLSGCDNMRIEEVPAESSSLSKEHCFILEVEHDIFVLMPEGAKATHRRKIISIANTLRDDYHNGRATIEIIDEFSSDEDISLFFEALGSGSKEEITEALSSESFARHGTAVFLYKVLQGEDLELDTLSRPYKQKYLSSDDMYILDTPDSGIFIWIGCNVDADTKKNYADTLQKYLDLKGYPSWIHATRVSEGVESSLFKQYFTNWDVDVSLTISSIAAYTSIDGEAAEVARLIGKSATASAYMPDSGDGSLVVTRFSGDQEDLSEQFDSGVSVLYQGDVYVVKYRYTGDCGNDSHVLYYWVGADAKIEDKEAAFEMLTQLEDELGANTTLVKVPQGKEPKHFLSIFKGNLVVLFGGKDNEYAPDNSNHDYEDTCIRLFRVEGTELGVDMRAVQVPETATSLEDDDVFVLETKDTVYIRLGKESDPKEQAAAMDFIKMVAKEEHSLVTLEQGDEPEEFWEALGGETEEKEDNSGWRNTINRRVNAERILTAATVRVSGKIDFEEIPSYNQEDLSDDSVYILDTGEELFYWKGQTVPERVLLARNRIIEEYIEDDGLERTADSAVVVAVTRGGEPPIFKSLFPTWDDDMWSNQSPYDFIKNELKAGNS